MSFYKGLCSKSIAPHPSWYRQMPILPILPRNLEAKKKEIKFSNEQQEGDLSASKLFCRSIACTLHMFCCEDLSIYWLHCARQLISPAHALHYFHPPSTSQQTNCFISYLRNKLLIKGLKYILLLFLNTYKCHFKSELNEAWLTACRIE